MVERPDRPDEPEGADARSDTGHGAEDGPTSPDRDLSHVVGSHNDARTDDRAGISDLAALQADDALLDVLGGANPDLASELGDSELNALLLSWRQQTDSEPIAELVDVETATATIMAATAAPARRRRRMLVPMASAAAVLAIAFGGVSLAAKGAHPGDTLWGLTQVLYADHARSVVAAADIRDDFGVARDALAAGHFSDARSALVRAKQTIPTVQRADGRGDLQATRQSLLEQVNNGGPPANGGTDEPRSNDPAVPPVDSAASASPDPGGGTVTNPPASGSPDPPSSDTSDPPSSSTPGTSTSNPPPDSGTGTHGGHAQVPSSSAEHG